MAHLDEKIFNQIRKSSMKNIRSFLQVGVCVLLGVSTLSWACTKNLHVKTPIFPTASDSLGMDSPAIKIGNLVFISGQGSGSTKNTKDLEAQIEEAFKKLRNVANASGGGLDDIVKITVYLADLSDYPLLNKIMSQYFKKPYPARSTVGASSLPKDHRIEVDAIMLVRK
jgi:reactive intermediate/imine deaminase